MARTLTIAATTTLALGAAGGALAHPYGWHIGADGAGDIKVDFLWDVTHKAWRTDPAFDGIVDNNLNFEEWAQPDPINDYFAMDPGAKIVVEFTSFDAGTFVWDPDDLGAGPMSTPGAQLSLGTTGDAFVKNALWQIDPDAPGFDAGKGVWEISMVFKDLSGAYGDSEEYTFLLEPAAVPAPSGAALLAGAGVLGARRRRR